MQKQWGAIRSLYTCTKQIVLLFTHIAYVLKILKVSDTNLISDQMWSHIYGFPPVYDQSDEYTGEVSVCLYVFLCVYLTYLDLWKWVDHNWAKSIKS